MIINAKPVRSPRKAYECCMCPRPVDGPHICLYGTKPEGGRPFTVRVHPTCVPQHRIDTEPLIAAALEKLFAEKA